MQAPVTSQVISVTTPIATSVTVQLPNGENDDTAVVVTASEQDTVSVLPIECLISELTVEEQTSEQIAASADSASEPNSARSDLIETCLTEPEPEPVREPKKSNGTWFEICCLISVVQYCHLHSVYVCVQQNNLQ